MKKIFFATILLSICLSTGAKVKTAGSAAEVAALKTLNAGDTLMLRAGEWADQQLKIEGQGTSSNPVVVMAAEMGRTVFTGKSMLSFSGEYITVAGLWFRDITPLDGKSVINFRTSEDKTANRCTLTDCAITGDGLAVGDMTDTKWVSVWGTENFIKNCTFRGKSNIGCLFVVWFEEGITPTHTIKGNYFSRPHTIVDEKGSKLNGQETIRIGTSHVSMSNGRCTVEGNYFYRCDGETEIISNKSCENTYRGNNFVECAGTLTLRHGNRCTVEGNFFFGNSVKGTGGIRIIGEQHKVWNNYLQDLTGEGYHSAISTLQGETNPALNGYFRALDCDIVYNTIVNCKTGITINAGSSRQKEPVENIRVSDNVIVSHKDSFTAITVVHTPVEPVNIQWANNICFGGKFTGITAQQAAVVSVDPKLEQYQDQGQWRPAKGSPLDKYARSGNDFVTTDILNRPRQAEKKSPGAFNVYGRYEVVIPMAINSGASWFVHKN